MYTYRKMIVTIVGAVVACVALHVLVFANLHTRWSETERQISDSIERFREMTAGLPLNINNADQMNTLIRTYNREIEAQHQALDNIHARLPIYPPITAEEDARMTPIILDWLRRISQVEKETEGTRIRILENLGIGLDEAPGRNGSLGFMASDRSVRSYLVFRPTEPSRPRIHGGSGVVEFWFRPNWTAKQYEPRRMLFFARSSPERRDSGRDALADADSSISLWVEETFLVASLKAKGYKPKIFQADITGMAQGQWYHFAFLYVEGNALLFANGQRLSLMTDRDQMPRRRPGGQAPTTGTNYEEFARMMGLVGGARGPAQRRPAAREQRDDQQAPARFTVGDLQELYIGGLPDFTEAADGTFEDFRIKQTDNFVFQPRYDGKGPRVLFYEDFEDEMIPESEVPDAMVMAQTQLSIFYDKTFDRAIRNRSWDKLQLVRSMLGGVSERQTQVATEFSSFPKRLFACDRVASAINDSATSVLAKLDFQPPDPAIIRELYLYLVVGKDLAEHAADSGIAALPVYRYLGGSEDINDERLRKYIETRLKQLTARQMLFSEEQRLERLRQLNIPLDFRERDAMVEALEAARGQKFPPHWLRQEYQTQKKPEERTDDYRRILINMNLLGDVVSITRYLHALEQSTHLVTIEDMNLLTSEDGSRQLRLTMNCEAHFLSPPPAYESEVAPRTAGANPGPAGAS